MSEIEIAMQALSSAVEGNSTNLVFLVVLSLLIFGVRHGLEWYKVRAMREDAEAAVKKEDRKLQHDDQWKLFEETKVESRRVKSENRKLYGLYRESLTFHIEAQSQYLQAIGKIKQVVPPRDVKCPYPICKVRQAFEADLDAVVLEAQSSVNETFRKWLERANQKDSGEIQ